MIAFVTLFLALVTGVQTVQVTVGEGVAAVELRLDGRGVAYLEGEPWAADCDFGGELAPHRLTAIAYDAGGAEVARAEQWINLPRPRSQVELLPESAPGEPPRTVRVLWESVDGARPDAVAVTFDGTPIGVGDPARVELPAYDPGRTHLLRAELRFGYSLAHAELVIGGPAGESVGSELTSFPVLLTARGSPPAAEEMAGWFQQAGRDLQVVAVDGGPANLVLVQDQAPRILGQLQRLRRDLTGAARSQPGTRPGPTGIKHGDRLWVIVPWALPAGGTAARELFPISGDLAIADRTPTTVGVGQRRVAAPRVSGLLAGAFYRAPPVAAPHRLADAVAEAGRAAAAGGRPRAVILVTGPRADDDSRFSADEVRAYLQRLQVPLAVWAPEAPAGWSTWGERTELIRGRSQLRRAVRAARAMVDPQIVVWLEGSHLPQEIELTAAARGTLRPVARRD